MQFVAVAFLHSLLIFLTASGIIQGTGNGNTEAQVFAFSFNGTQSSGQDFTARTGPAPRAVIYSGKTPINPNDTIRANFISTLKCVIEPSDAKYKIKVMDVVLARGTVTVAKMTSFDGEPNLGSFINQTRPGDRVIFSVKKVVLVNADGKEEIVHLSSGSVISIQITF